MSSFQEKITNCLPFQEIIITNCLLFKRKYQIVSFEEKVANCLLFKRQGVINRSKGVSLSLSGIRIKQKLQICVLLYFADICIIFVCRYMHYIFSRCMYYIFWQIYVSYASFGLFMACPVGTGSTFANVLPPIPPRFTLL